MEKDLVDVKKDLTDPRKRTEHHPGRKKKQAPSQIPGCFFTRSPLTSPSLSFDPEEPLCVPSQNLFHVSGRDLE